MDSLPTSANQEDHVSMATFAARRLQPMLRNTAHIVAIELLAAVPSGLLLSTETVSSALELITTLVAETVSDVDGAGVTLLDEHGERTTAAATDPVVTHADALQYELGDGPCLTAWAQRVTVRVVVTPAGLVWTAYPPPARSTTDTSAPSMTGAPENRAYPRR